MFPDTLSDDMGCEPRLGKTPGVDDVDGNDGRTASARHGSGDSS